ncbi:MAG: class peptide chain release factor, partial [Bacteroidetes bacterium]|nr:class peptide chain release factor [Bacteroidota bacterium]
AILSTLRTRIDSGGVLRLMVQESRSQMRNRELALERFASLLREALRPRKGRKKTRPTTTSRHERIASKARRGATKKLRGRVDGEF